jgi:hypothetical protein
VTRSSPCSDLADRKGFDVTQSTMRDHVRLIDGDGNLVKNKERRRGQL